MQYLYDQNIHRINLISTIILLSLIIIYQIRGGQPVNHDRLIYLFENIGRSHGTAFLS